MTHPEFEQEPLPLEQLGVMGRQFVAEYLKGEMERIAAYIAVAPLDQRQYDQFRGHYLALLGMHTQVTTENENG